MNDYLTNYYDDARKIPLKWSASLLLQTKITWLTLFLSS